MKFFYQLFVILYSAAIHFAAPFSSKARLWVRGRKNIFQRLRSARAENSGDLLWVHCASLGEFEQGRPLIEEIKKKYPSKKILLTFFSPSGFEVRKNYKGADLVFYLPADLPWNVRRFLEITKPQAVFFIKYEFWFNYLSLLKKQNIPVYLVSGIFRKDQHFFKPYGSWFRRQLQAFSHFFLQDENSAILLRSAGFQNITVAGDTRFDRVADVAKQATEIAVAAAFVKNQPCIVAGSAWKEDASVLFGSGEARKFKIIIAPHEVNDSSLGYIEQECISNGLSSQRFSAAGSDGIADAGVLIIDNIGMLSSLYRYATVAFVGGGFGKGIHNILEAATYGTPVIIGPNFQKFREAKELIHAGGAFDVKNSADLNRVLQLLSDPQVLATTQYVARSYVHSKVGATAKILHEVNLL